MKKKIPQKDEDSEGLRSPVKVKKPKKKVTGKELERLMNDEDIQ